MKLGLSVVNGVHSSTSPTHSSPKVGSGGVGFLRMGGGSLRSGGKGCKVGYGEVTKCLYKGALWGICIKVGNVEQTVWDRNVWIK